MRDEPQKANELLRSAHAIASRKGADTNWEGFTRSLEECLVEQSKLLNGIDLIPAATCTPRVYKTIKE